MYDSAFPITYYYSWESVSDAMIPNVMAEFRKNGVENLVMSHIWLDRILRDMSFWSILARHARNQHVHLVEAHAPWGQGYNLSCPERARRPQIPKIKQLPRLISMQTEVRTVPTCLTIAELVRTFRSLTETAAATE